MTKKSLKARASKLSDTQHQLDYLSNGIFKDGSLPTFKEKLTHYGLAEIPTQKTKHSSNKYWVHVQSSLRTLPR